MKIKYANAEYTGGGFYEYFGEWEDGLCFITSECWEDENGICIVNTTEIPEDGSVYDEIIKDEFFDDGFNVYKEIIRWILDNIPAGNYSSDELEDRINNH